MATSDLLFFSLSHFNSFDSSVHLSPTGEQNSEYLFFLPSSPSSDPHQTFVATTLQLKFRNQHKTTPVDPDAKIENSVVFFFLFFFIFSMCLTQGFKSYTCHHRWLTITHPCGPDRGFDNCRRLTAQQPSLFSGRQTWYYATAGSCPVDGLKGNYDGNMIRVVRRDGGGRRGGWQDYYAHSTVPILDEDGGRPYYSGRESDIVCCVVQ